MKKLIAIVLSAVMIVCAIPVSSVSAADPANVPTKAVVVLADNFGSVVTKEFSIGAAHRSSDTGSY